MNRRKKKKTITEFVSIEISSVHSPSQNHILRLIGENRTRAKVSNREYTFLIFYFLNRNIFNYTFPLLLRSTSIIFSTVSSKWERNYSSSWKISITISGSAIGMGRRRETNRSRVSFSQNCKKSLPLIICPSSYNAYTKEEYSLWNGVLYFY